MARDLGFRVPILYSDICGGTSTRAELETLIARLDWKAVVSRAAGIAAISWRHGVEDESHQTQLVKAMTHGLVLGPAIERMIASDPHRLLFSREGLFAMLR